MDTIQSEGHQLLKVYPEQQSRVTLGKQRHRAMDAATVLDGMVDPAVSTTKLKIRRANVNAKYVYKMAQQSKILKEEQREVHQKCPPRRLCLS